MTKTALFLMLYFACFLTGEARAQKLAGADQKKATRAELQRGKALYESFSCKACHGETGALQGNLTKAHKKYTDEEMRLYISNPRQYDNITMPVYSGVISDADFRPLIRYVRHLGYLEEQKNRKKK